jgi:hypothetical protein
MANCDFYGICDKISTEATRNFHNAVGIVLTDISNRTPDPYNPHIPGLRYDDSSCHNPIIYDDPSRIWRDSTEDFKRVFYAVAAIRSIAVAARWVERRWTALPFGTKSPGNFLKLSRNDWVCYHPGAPEERFFEHTSIAFPHWEVPILIGDDDEVYLDDGVELAYHVSMPPKYREAFLTAGIIH